MKQVISKSVLVILFMALLVPSVSLANLSLNKVLIRFEKGDRPVNNISITNKGAIILKVRAEIIEVKNAGQDSVEELKTRDLMLAPKVFELKPGETRVARVVLRKPPKDREKIFRVRFIPDKVAQTEEMESNGMSVKIGVVIGMGALVIAAPQNPSPKLTFTREDGKITFVNEGNITAQLQRDKFCSDDVPECINLSGKRIYPGATYVLDVPLVLIGKPFSQTILMNNSYNVVDFPP